MRQTLDDRMSLFAVAIMLSAFMTLVRLLPQRLCDRAACHVAPGSA